MLKSESRNPFASAKIVGVQVDPTDYCRQVVPRGHPEYVMSRSELTAFLKCPHRWVQGHKEEGTKAMNWGSMLDCYLLDNARFERTYVIAPATYTSKNGEEKPWNRNATYCEDWEIAQAPKEVIKQQELEKLKAAAAAIRSDPDLAELIDASQKQVMVVGRYADVATQIAIDVKGLIDLVPPASNLCSNGLSLLDMKTTCDASPKKWAREVFNYGLHTQAAMYLDLYRLATGEERYSFRHLVQESFAPWEIGKRCLSHEFITLGRAEYTEALKLYCWCLRSNKWPTYDDLLKRQEPHIPVIEGWLTTEPDARMVA